MTHLKQKGFTLIEAVLYIALFSILITGTIITAYELLRGSDELNRKIVTQREGGFVLSKIETMLNGASAISTPTAGGADNMTVLKYDGSRHDIRLNGDMIELRENPSNPFLPITTANVTVDSLIFEKIEAAGISPEGIRAVVYVNGARFETTKYIRK